MYKILQWLHFAHSVINTRRIKTGCSGYFLPSTASLQLSNYIFVSQAVKEILTSTSALSTGRCENCLFIFIINSSPEKLCDSSVCSSDSTWALYCTLSVDVCHPCVHLIVKMHLLLPANGKWDFSYFFFCLFCQHVSSQKGRKDCLRNIYAAFRIFYSLLTPFTPMKRLIINMNKFDRKYSKVSGCSHASPSCVSSVMILLWSDKV